MITTLEWFEQFQPKPNHLDANASFQLDDVGHMFETYGPELDYVKTQDPNTIWTLIDTDDGEPTIVNGFYMVNRVGYFVTKYPCDPDAFIQVYLD